MTGLIQTNHDAPMSAVDSSLDLGLQDDFPVLARQIDGRRVVYLDNAATTLKPSAVIEAVTEYYEKYSANIHRGKHRLSEEASNRYEDARYQVAMFLNCRINEVVFVRNTTEALNMLARGLGLTRRDIVIGFTDSHHSNILPWREVADFRFVKTIGGLPDLDHYRALLRLKPKLVALTHCSNVTGLYAPVDMLASLAKDVGATVVVDGGQSVPHRAPDLGHTDIDFLAFSGHKMLAPTGIGVLFGKSSQLEGLSPTYVGGGVVDWVSEQSSKLRKLPHRLEAGTPAIEGAIGLAAAIRYIGAIGEDVLEEHDKGLARTMYQEVAQRSYARILGPEDGTDRAAILSLYVPGIPDLGDLATSLSDGFGVMARSGHLCAQPYVDEHAPGQVLRLSAYIYNTSEDIRCAFSGLDRIVGNLQA